MSFATSQGKFISFLTGTYKNGYEMEWKNTRFLPFMVGVLGVILMPYLHLGLAYRFWRGKRHKHHLDRGVCNCTCWDMFFKGSYENGIPRYKHVYFNVTLETLCIWILCVAGTVVFYESLCYIARLASKYQIRCSMLILFCVSIYPHYYGWWAYINYLNDGYYGQWNHQLFFSTGELISSVVVLHLIDRKRAVQPDWLLVIVDISLVHIMASGGDQFVKNVLLGKGDLFKVVRDLGLMVPDWINIVVSLLELKIWAKQNNTTMKHIFGLNKIVFHIILIILLVIFCELL